MSIVNISEFEPLGQPCPTNCSGVLTIHWETRELFWKCHICENKFTSKELEEIRLMKKVLE